MTVVVIDTLLLEACICEAVTVTLSVHSVWLLMWWRLWYIWAIF